MKTNPISLTHRTALAWLGAILLSMSLSNAMAYNRIFALRLYNETASNVTFTITPGTCYQGTGVGYFGGETDRSLSRGPVAPGDYTDIWVARNQEGCDGEAGYFGISPSTYPGEGQSFAFSNDGMMSQIAPTPNGFSGGLTSTVYNNNTEIFYTWTLKNMVTRLSGPLDERLTMPRNPIAKNFGKWDGDGDDGGSTQTDILEFRKNGFTGFDYHECALQKQFHTQHIVRMPNKNGHAYFVVANSLAYVPNLPLVSALSRGTVAVYRTDAAPDPVTDLVPNNPGTDGEIVWEHTFDRASPIGMWNHPCKMEMIGNLLLVSMQHFSGNGTCRWGNGDEEAVVFYDVRDPENPKYWGKMGAATLGGPHGTPDEVSEVTMSRQGDMWILNAGAWKGPGYEANLFSTRKVGPNIGDWTRFGWASSGGPHGGAFNSFEIYDAPATPPLGIDIPGQERTMFADGGCDNGCPNDSIPWVNPIGDNHVVGDEFLEFSTMRRTPTSVPKTNRLYYPAPNLFVSDNDYDACGPYVTRRGMVVMYAPLQHYPEKAGGDDSADMIYQVWHPANLALETPHPDQVVTTLADDGIGSLRRAIGYGGRITFAPSLNNGTIVLENGPLFVYPYDVNIDASALPNGITIRSPLSDNRASIQVMDPNTLTMSGFKTDDRLTFALTSDFDGLWTTGGAESWFEQPYISPNVGYPATKSGVIKDSQTTYLQSSVSGPGTLTFWWKVSSEANFDFLRFTMDGMETTAAPAISGEVGWVEMTVPVPAGSHTLRWTYEKDFSGAAGSDAGFLDEVHFEPLLPKITSPLWASGPLGVPFNYQITASTTPTNYNATRLPAGLTVDTSTGLISGTPSVVGYFYVYLTARSDAGSGNATLTLSIAPLAPALDTTGLMWESDGDGGLGRWFGQSVITHDGVDAAQSGAIGNLQSAFVFTTVTGPGTLTFWWKVSSEAGGDFLSFRFYGQAGDAVPAISGEVDWVQKTVTVPAGRQTLYWLYDKNGSVAGGSDAAWLDQVVFTPHQPEEIAIEQPVGTPLNNGTIVDFGTQLSGSPTTPKTFTIKNTGDSSLNISGVSTIGVQSGDFTVNTTGMLTSIPAASQTTFTVTFTPGALGGRTGFLQVVSDDADEGTLSFVLTGTGVAVAPPSLPEAVDTPALVWTTSGNSVWNGQTATTHDGMDAAQGGPSVDGSESYLQTTVTGPGTLKFWWKTTASAYLYLGLSIYGETPADTLIAGEVDWQEKTVIVPTGSTTLRWRIYDSARNESSFGFLDQVVFVPTQPEIAIEQPVGTPLNYGATLDFGTQLSGSPTTPKTFTIKNTGNSPLNISPLGIAGDESSDFVINTAGMLTSIPAASQTTFTVTFTPGALGGRTGVLQVVSDDADEDYLIFFLTGTGVAVAPPSLPEAVDTPALVWTTSGNSVWNGQTATTHDGVDAAQSGDIGDGQESWLETTVTGPGTLGFWWRVSSEQNYDYLLFTLNGVQQAAALEISGEMGWEQKTVSVPAGSHTLRWNYFKDGSESSGADAGWVDQVVFTPTQPEIAIDLPSGTIAVGGVVAWGYNGNGQTTVPLAAQSGVIGIAAGYVHTAALKTDGTVVAWGSNDYGETAVPVDLNGVVAIAGTRFHTAALKSNGTVRTWGYGTETTVPPGLNDVRAIAAGFAFTVALKNDGSVVAWGNNSHGQATVPAAALSGVIAIAANDLHALALKSDGSVIAWGNPANGRTTVPVAALTGVIAIAAGGNHSLALKSDGTVVAWGQSSEGQTTVPAGLSGVVAIAAGDFNSAAIKSDGSVVAWGYPDFGFNTVPVAALSNALAIAGGGNHAVALVGTRIVDFGSQPIGVAGPWKTFTIKNVGTVPLHFTGATITGANPLDFIMNTAATLGTIPVGGQTTLTVAFTPTDLGDRNATLNVFSDDPEAATVSFDLRGIGTGVLVREIAIDLPPGTIAVGGVVAWGENGNGQTTVPVAAQSGVTGIAAGYVHTAALKTDGTVVAWGNNSFGETAVPVDLNGVVAIAGTRFHTAALKSNGTVRTWGYGTETTVPPGLNDVRAIAAGFAFTVALKNDGSVVAWGNNSHGQATVPAAALSGVIAIAANDLHALALKSDGSVIAWGNPANGRTTVPVAALTGVIAIAAGGNHSLALKSDGTVVAWGQSSEGQTTVPAGLSGVVAIAAGDFNSAAIKSDGSVVAWGYPDFGFNTVPVAALSNALAIAGGGNHAVALVGTRIVDFGSQPIGVAGPWKTFTIKNTGSAALSITSVSVVGFNSGDFAVDTSGMLASIPAAGQTTFRVLFNAGAPGARPIILRVLNNDADESIKDITLTGTGSTTLASLQFGVSGAGTNTLTFVGIPGSQYIAQYATNLSTSPWFDFRTNAAGTNGLWQVIAPNATNVQRFYRVRTP